MPTWPAAKVLWVQGNEPEVFAQGRDKILLIEDYFLHRLTGQLRLRRLADLLHGLLGHQHPALVAGHAAAPADRRGPAAADPRVRGAGRARSCRAVARELGLAPETVVCTGALDQAAGAIGVGNIRPGVFSENTGAALAICATVDHPVFDPKGRMPCHYHGIPGTYMAHTFTTGGMVLKWYRDTFCQPEIQVGALAGLDPYELLGREAARVAPGAEGLVMLPHLQGAMAPEANPKAKGVLYGITLRHTKAHVARAIMEAIACIVRRNIEVVEELGIRVSEIRGLGGGSRSAVWNQIKADLTGRPVLTMENEEAACLGAAIVAGVGVGLFRSLPEACARMVQVKGRHEPDPAHAGAYAAHYARYVGLYDSLVGMFARETS